MPPTLRASGSAVPDVPRFISSRLAKRREGGVSACTGSSVERFIGQRPAGGWALGGQCAGSRLRQVQRKVSGLVGRTGRVGKQLRVRSARTVSRYQPVGCGRVASSGPRAQTGPLARRPHPRSYGSRCPPCGRAGPGERRAVHMWARGTRAADCLHTPCGARASSGLARGAPRHGQ